MTQPFLNESPSPLTTVMGLFDYGHAVENLRSTIRGLNDAVATNKRIQTALENIRDYGMDKPRMKLLQADAELGLFDQVECPSVEAFDLVSASPKDSRTQTVGNCLSAAVLSDKALLSSWLDVALPGVESLFTAMESSVLPTLKAHVTALYAAPREDAVEVQLAAPEAAYLTQGLSMLRTLLKDIAPLDPDLLIVDTDYRNTLRGSFESIVQNGGETLGVYLSKEGYLEFTESPNNPSQETLSSEALGYTPDTAKALLEAAAGAIDGLETVIASREAILRGLDTASVALDAVEGMESYTLVDHKNAVAGYATLLTATLSGAVDLINRTTKAVYDYQKI